ncbi:probable serine/threonine-protein kinase At1g09600 [Rutidosis leptorrhynchoides]|uniref:probable serine/threonine-protein kinase At1g09600 n=1 Tax=Rutidosis leptorrhynchoides TaxID=125765 RepID=UPI003A99CAFC
MGGICSKNCGTSRNDRQEEEGKFDGIQVADPVNKESVTQNINNEKQKDNHKQSLSERVLGSKRIQKIKSIVGGTQGAQKAAGWPSWLTSVASEAVQGWVPRSADSYEMLNKIGQGTYSSVYKARDLQNDRIVAIKKVRFVNMDPESVRFMAREICILRRLDHPNCMKLQALVTSKFSGTLYLVFDYMEHDLAGLLQTQKVKKFTLPQIKCYMQQLLLGMEHCHSRGILHRDLKGANILLDNNGILKIGDFGLAARFEPGQKEPLTSRVVTLWYRAPELLFGSTSYGVAIDMWSAGCILAELFLGRPIMPGRTEVEQIHKIFKLCGSPSEEYWSKSKLPHATSFKPQHPYERRIIDTFQQYLPSSALALLDTLLAIEPEARGTATSALSSEFFTTEPLPCDPSNLPVYPPSKEFDARYREEEARKRKAEAMKGHAPDSVRVADFKSQSKPQGQLVARKYNPQERRAKKGFSYSNSEIHQSAVTSLAKNLKDDTLGTSLRMVLLHNDPAPKGPMTNMHPAQESTKLDYSTNKVTMGHAKRINRVYSGPLMPPGGSTEDMLKEHERHIQAAVRKARAEKAKSRLL